MNTSVWPEPRLLERLVARVRFGAAAGPFLAGGDALAVALAGAEGGKLPAWVESLADAMVGSLLRVQDATMDEASAEDRVRLAQATALLSVVRPRAAAACDAAISVWMGWGIGEPRLMLGCEGLVARSLLAMYLDDLDQAACCVSELLDREPDGIGLVLHDWVVARVQGHGLARDARCLEHFVLAASFGAAGEEVVLRPLAALVHHSLSGPNRDQLLDSLVPAPPRGAAPRPANAATALQIRGADARGGT